MSIDPKSLDNALGVLDNAIYVPVFQQKLASAGLAPQNQEELIEFLQLGHVLRDRVSAHQTKQATDRVSQLRQLRESLVGRSAPQQPRFAEFGKQAAANPQIADAVLHLLASQQAA